MLSQGDDLHVLDVRTEKEWNGGRVKGSQHLFAGYIRGRIEEVPRGRKVAVLCSSGLRGSLAAGLLQDAGHNVLNVLGGTSGWSKAGLSLVK
jgi:hydroxyacylglutathione hydrolase